MLLNISGVIGADNLSAVIIYGADFNFANKLYFGSRLMKRAESSGVLPQEQHRRISKQMSTEVVVLKFLLFEYVRHKRINMRLGFIMQKFSMNVYHTTLLHLLISSLICHFQK